MAISVPEQATLRTANRTTADLPIHPLELMLGDSESLIFLREDGDLSVNVQAGTHEGRPLRYDALGGMVLVALDVDDNHDDVRVEIGMGQRADMLHVLREAIDTLEQSVKALERVSKA